jgi:hypothetical protein
MHSFALTPIVRRDFKFNSQGDASTACELGKHLCVEMPRYEWTKPKSPFLRALVLSSSAITL